jgi:hypothetical protein
MPYDIHPKFLRWELDKPTAKAVYLAWRKIISPDRKGLEMSKDIRGNYTLWRDRVYVDEITIQEGTVSLGYRVIVDDKDRILAMFRKSDDPDYQRVYANLTLLQAMAKDVW